jgi:uncharacterized protein with GYD domain
MRENPPSPPFGKGGMGGFKGVFLTKPEFRIDRKSWIPGRASLARNDDFLLVSRVLQEPQYKEGKKVIRLKPKAVLRIPLRSGIRCPRRTSKEIEGEELISYSESEKEYHSGRTISSSGGGKMATYIILSRFSPEAFEDPKDFLKLAEQVSSRIKKDCPGIRWKGSYATLGRFDVVDIVEAENPKEIEKAAMIIRGFGHSTTETLVGTPWKDFLAGLS